MTFIQSVRRTLHIGRATTVDEPVDARRASTTTVLPGPEIDIGPTDPLLAYLQAAPGPVDLATLHLDSPAVRSLREAGVVLVVPLVSQGELIGTLNLGPRLSEQEYSSDDRRLLASLAAQAAPAVRVAQLVQEQAAEIQSRERYEQELRVATLIQQQFLPRQLPDLPDWQVAAYYGPARAVGGDFYDFIELAAAPTTESRRTGAPEQARPKGVPALTRRDLELEFWRTGKGAPRMAPKQPMRSSQMSGELGRLGIVIADVTDKGVPAALFMALSRTLIRATASDGRPPAAVFEQANRLILDDARSGLFVTCFYGILDATNNTFVYANGGHNYPLHYQSATDQVESLQAQGIVLGIVPEPHFEQRAVTIAPGDVVCFYTDGITEAMDSRRQLFDEERLIEVLRRSHNLPPEQIIERIIEAVTNFSAGAPQTDDMTLVVLKRET